jgi:hypothetical protein
MVITCRQDSDDVMLAVFVGEHSLVVEDVIDEDVVSKIFRVALVVVLVLEYLTSLVHDSLVEVLQELALLLVLVVSRCELENRVGIHQRLIL